MARKNSRTADKSDRNDGLKGDDPVNKDGVPEENRIKQEIPARKPGDRAHRQNEWRFLKRVELRRAAEAEDRAISEDELASQAQAALEEVLRRPDGSVVWKQFEATAQTSTDFDRNQIHTEPEVSAVMRLPVMRWLRELMSERPNNDGPEPERDLITAGFFSMAFGATKPELKKTRRALSYGHTALSWAFDYPGIRKKSAFACGMHDMLQGTNPDAVIHANVSLFRKLASLTDKKGNLLHPNAGRWLSVDGTEVQADVQQKMPIGEKDSPERAEHRGLLYGPMRELVDFVLYDRGEGKGKSWAGYKLVVLSDVATGLPLMWTLTRATSHEWPEVEQMLKTLFKLWPDCPAEVLSGDSLIDVSEEFAHDLVFRWGLHPCFVMRGGYGESDDHVKTKGVPVCDCPGGKDLMKLDSTDAWPTPANRAKAGLARGEMWQKTNIRIRWACANGRAGCKGKVTRPRDNARLYTYLPRASLHPRAALREALLLRRNSIESLYSKFKGIGLAGTASDRPGWAHDAEMVWLTSAGLLAHTARRLVHETGMYADAKREFESLGLKDQPTLDIPAPGPTPEQLKIVRDQRIERDGPTEAPETWTDDLAAPWDLVEPWDLADCA